MPAAKRKAGSASDASSKRPKPKPAAAVDRRAAQQKAAAKKRAASPNESSYHEDDSEDELKSDGPPPPQADSEWDEDDDVRGARSKAKGSKKASPQKKGVKGAARGRTGPGAPVPAGKRRRNRIGSDIDPLDEEVESDASNSMASWNGSDCEQWEDKYRNGSAIQDLEVGHVLRFRPHPRRGYPQYRVIWKDVSIYCSTWECEHVFVAQERGTTIADLFWARMPTGRPPDVPRPQEGEHPPEVSLSDTDVDVWDHLSPREQREKRQKNARRVEGRQKTSARVASVSAGCGHARCTGGCSCCGRAYPHHGER